jgi:hypothetical protein
MCWGRSALAVLTVAAVPLGACKDGDDDGAEATGTTAPSVEATTERVAAWFAHQPDPNGLQFTADEADCAADAVIDALGAARIEQLRTDAANDVGGPEGLDLLREPPLEADEADTVFAAMTGCIDLAAQVTDLFLASGKSPEAARCMAERYIATDVLEEAIMTARADADLTADINRTLVEIGSTCSTPGN